MLDGLSQAFPSVAVGQFVVCQLSVLTRSDRNNRMLIQEPRESSGGNAASHPC